MAHLPIRRADFDVQGFLAYTAAALLLAEIERMDRAAIDALARSVTAPAHDNEGE